MSWVLLHKSTIIGMEGGFGPDLFGFVPKGGSPNDSGVLEIIVPDAQASVRWAKHGYPSSLAKWHHHPHIEIHLIGKVPIDDGGQCRCSV